MYAPVADQTQAARDRRLGIPFLIFMATSGLPLGYSLQPTRVLAVADVAEMTAQAASADNTLGSLANIVLLGALYGWSAWMLLTRPRSSATIMVRTWPLLAFLALIGASVMWSFEPEKVVMNVVHNIGVILICLAAALHYRHAPDGFVRDLGLVLGTNMAVHLAAIAILPGYTIDWQARWQGLTVHPNTFGALALTTFWANAAVLAGRLDKRRHWYWAGVLMALAAMIGADSKTSQLTSIVTVCTLLGLRFLVRRHARLPLYAALVVVGGTMLVLYKVIAATVDLSFLFEAVGRDPEFTGRAQVWEDAFKAIGAKPLLGWSFDDHAYLIATAGMPYSSYHSGLLDLAVNGGAIAIALLAALMLSWVACYFRPDGVARRIAPWSVAYVIAYVMHNLTEASYVAPRGQLWVMFLGVLFLCACSASGRRRARPLPPPRCAPGWSVAG